MNTHLASLLTVARLYAAHRSLSMSHVSKLSTGGGKVLDSIEGGADMTTGRLTSVMRWFSDNWPADLAWPAGVDRPVTGSGEPSSGNSPTSGVSSPALPGGADDAAAGPLNGEAA